jgi:2-oxoglutarate ferredoxin oxidoreductase subunit alpha
MISKSKPRKIIKDISVMIAGQAGDGVLFTGNVLAKIFKRHGWEVATFRDFPSNIRGEATNYTIRASLNKIYSCGDTLDILLAFDCGVCLVHIKNLAERGVVLCDGQEIEEPAPHLTKGKTKHRFLLRKLAKENFGQEIFKNMIALGALSYILNLDSKVLEQIISETFLERKGPEIVQKNIQAASLGYKKAKDVIKPSERHPLVEKKDTNRLILSGNEAIAFGALAAGCRFFAAYPICPATEIWEWLLEYFPESNGLVVQTEDELAALNMALGASYAGARAMTSTSGPGASLMMEAFSLAGMTEIPVVVAHVQRLGPATGIPTKTQQGDLNEWIYGSHGEFPRIVLSPGTLEECFEFTFKAFNLAEKYQCPVIILTEGDMGQNLRTSLKFSLSNKIIDRGKLLSQDELLRIKNYKRYELTADGISWRAIPGLINGIHLVESLEHDERGYRNEDPENRVRMMGKRMQKLKKARKDLVPPNIWGDRKAKIGVIGFGSTVGPILEATERLKEEGKNAKFLQLRTLWPFPSERIQEFLAGCRRVFVVENNYTAQLAALIRSQVNPAPKMESVLKYSTHPFKPQDVYMEIKKALK